MEYNYAVAGHAGTMCDADGELFIKPCTQAEVDFYESAHQSHPDFAAIMPTYIGTLALTETTNQAEIRAQIPDLVEHADIPAHLKEEIQSHLHLDKRRAIEASSSKKPVVDNVWVPNRTRRITTDRAVVLDNASWGYKRPNILDAKLGLRLWADDAPQQKKDRFNQIAAETTHKNFGFRVAGMRVYKGSTDESELDKDGYRIYDKDWGRLAVKDANLLESLKKFIFNEIAGIDRELGKYIAARFAKDLRHIQSVFENEESRMFSSSLLFVFEGDGDALRAAIEEEKSLLAASETAAKAGHVVPANLRVDSGIGMSEEELGEGQTVITVNLDDDDFGDEEEVDLPRIHGVKIIDFAHAEWKPGQGPDENVLKGIRSLAQLFEEMSK